MEPVSDTNGLFITIIIYRRRNVMTYAKADDK